MFVSDDEVEQTLAQQIDDFIYRAGSVENLEQLMGKPLREIERDYWFEIKNMLMINQFKYLITSGVGVTRQEILAFYEEYKDSLPTVLPSYNYSVIDYPVVVSEKTKQGVFSFLNNLKDSLSQGKGFQELALIYSDDPGTAPVGGDLGYTTRGTLVSEYEVLAYSLKVGGVGGPIISPFGAHIIELVDRAGEKIHTRHILKLLKPSELDLNNSVE